MTGSTMKIYDGENLIVDAEFCRNNKTGEIGWYDHVGEKFHPAMQIQMPFPTNKSGVMYIDTGIRPKGEWQRSVDNDCEMHKCSVCGARVLKGLYEYENPNRYCYHCGAYMQLN